MLFWPNGHLRFSSCSDVLKTESYSRPEFYRVYKITILSLYLYIKEANFKIYHFYVIRTWASCNLLVLVCMCSECVQPAVVSQVARAIAIERALRGRSTLQYTATARFMRVLSFTLIGTMELKLAPKCCS